MHPQRRRLWAEIHKLRADGGDDSGSVFGHTDFSAIAKRLCLRDANATDLGQLPMLFDVFATPDRAEVRNIHVCDNAIAPQISAGRGER